MLTLFALPSSKWRLSILAMVFSATLSANSQVQSIVADKVLYAGRVDPQIIVTSNSNPNIDDLRPYLQNLPPAGMPNWPNFGPRGFLLENNDVQNFPQEVRVFQGIIRTFANGHLQYFHDVHGLEGFLSGLFGSMLSQDRRPEMSDRQTLEASPDRLVPLLPTNGYEPPYNPNAWNDHGVVEWNNNDYNYSANKKTGTFAQPGRAGGRLVSGPPFTCSDVLAAAIADGFVPWVADVPCSNYDYKVAFVVDPRPTGDYHSYRQDRGGNWSHKPGGTEATNLDKSGNPISDPRTADRGGYTEFCAFMCVLANPNLVNIR